MRIWNLPATWLAPLALGLALCLAACSDAGNGGDTTADGGMGIGTACSDSTACAAGLYCYSNSIPPDSDLNGMCTEDCNYGASTDECTTVTAAAFCSSSIGICVLRCSGTTCPNGTTCGTQTDDQGICVTTDE